MPYPEPPQMSGNYHGGYMPLEQTDMFSYSNRHPELIIGGPSGMSTMRRGSNNNNRHESPALSTFVPPGSVRTTTDPNSLNGDLV